MICSSVNRDRFIRLSFPKGRLNAAVEAFQRVTSASKS